MEKNKTIIISNILSQLRDTISACGCLHFSPKHHTAAEVQESRMLFSMCMLANTDTGSELSFYSQKRTIAVLTGITRPAIVHDKDRCGCACVTRALSTGLREDLLRTRRVRVRMPTCGILLSADSSKTPRLCRVDVCLLHIAMMLLARSKIPPDLSLVVKRFIFQLECTDAPQLTAPRKFLLKKDRHSSQVRAAMPSCSQRSDLQAPDQNSSIALRKQLHASCLFNSAPSSSDVRGQKSKYSPQQRKSVLM